MTMVPFSNTDCTTYDKNYKDKFENTPAIDFDLSYSNGTDLPYQYAPATVGYCVHITGWIAFAWPMRTH